MKTLVSLSRAKLETREGVMEGLARNGIRAAVQAVSLGELVTAAASPSISTTAASSGVATLAPVELTAATNAWSTYVDAVLYPFLAETYMAASQQTWEFVNGTLHVVTPKVVPITAEDYLRVAANRLKNVGNMLWSAIRDSLAQGYEAGESTHQLATRIRTLAKDVGESRALTIARTEVVSAANAASLTQVQLGGFTDLECRKRWLATEDERTRDIHRVADGQTVGLSEAFAVGGEYLQVPGDPNGRADNVINCRCTIEFVFTEDEDLDNLVASGGWCAPPEVSYDFLDVSSPPLVAGTGRTWKDWNASNTEHPKDSKGKWTSTPDSLTAMPDFGKMTSQQVETWYKSVGQDEWNATSPTLKAKIQKHANLFYDAEGNAGPKNKIKMLDAGKGDDSTVSVIPSVPKLIEAAKNGSSGTVLVGINANADKRVYKSGTGYRIQKVIAGKWMNVTEKLTLAELEKKLHGADWDESDTTGDTSLLAQTPSAPTSTTFTPSPLAQSAINAKVGDVVAINLGTGNRIVKTDSGFQEETLLFGKWKNTGPPLSVKSLTTELGKGWMSPPKKNGPKKSAAPNVAPKLTGKPIHINTKVIYGQEYDNGAVVAVKLADDQVDKPQFLTWNAGTKKFQLEYPNADGDWVAAEVYGKGAAYKKFSKESGWLAPDKSLVEAVVKSAEPGGSATSTPSSLPDMTGPLKSTSSVPTPKSVSDLSYLELSDLLTNNTADQLVAKYDTGELNKLDEKVSDMFTDNELSEEEAEEFGDKITEAIGKKIGIIPVSAPPASSAFPSPADGYFGPPITSAQDFADAPWIEKTAWLKAAGPTELDEFSLHGLDKLESQVHAMAKNGDLSDPDYQDAITKISAAKKQKMSGSTLTTISLSDINWDPKNASNAVAFDAWFAHNLLGKKLRWDQLTPNDRKLVEAAAFNATIFGYDTPSLTISKWANIDASSDDGQALHDQIQGMTNGELAGWFGSNIDQAKWNSLANETKDLLDQKAGTLSAMGWDGVKNQIKVFKANDTGASAKPVVNFGITVDDSDVSGPNAATPAKDADGNNVAWVQYALDGSGAFIYAIDPNTGYKKAYVGNVDFEDGEVLEETIANLVAVGKLKSTNVTPTPTPTPLPAPPPPPTPSAPPPHGYNAHVLANSAVKFVGDIGQPTDKPGPFKSITTDQMKKVQHDMLLLSDKKKWSNEEKNAVGFYGTKTGYQTMNAVLRNDEKRMKMFSESQLNDAVKSAALVQSSMTPLTESLELHRGTGAQQFGFKTKSISTAKLKQLQGTTITDRGFVSTSVVPPTAISYDYAKKPIKVIVNAPKGTPATYVDSAKPGHGENELLLGAGTSFHVNEVREATAADKALYGAHTEQVVTLTVVPATKKGPKDITGAATTSKSATATTTAPPSLKPLTSPALNPTPTLKSTPTLGGKPGGVPIKLNTNAIYKQAYAHGAVVAVKSGPSADGHTYRLVWHDTQKKFMLQLQNTAGDWLNAANLKQFKFGKGEAYKKFSGENDWVTPTPGDSALGTSGFGPYATPSPTPVLNMSKPIDEMSKTEFIDFVTTNKDIIKSDQIHEVSIFKNVAKDLDVVAEVAAILGGPASAPMTAPTPPVKPVKPPKFDAAQLQAMHGTPPPLTDSQKKYLWSNFKYGGTETTIHTQPATIFKKLHKVVETHNKNYPADKLNILQALKIIDERSSQYSVHGNQNVYEKKILDWLQTPSGKNTATKVMDPSSVTKGPGSKDASGGSETLKELLSKVKDPSEIGVPHTKHATFDAIAHGDIMALQKQIHATDPWTTAQKGSLANYTTQAYDSINGVLRGKKNLDNDSNKTAARSAKRAQDGMRPITKNVLVFRKTHADQFPGLHALAPFADIKKLEGHVFQDKGFVSTSIHKGTWSGNVEIEIEVPEGTPMAYVGGPGNISHHKSEYEMILAAGLRYRVLKVEPNSYGSATGAKVRVRVEP